MGGGEKTEGDENGVQFSDQLGHQEGYDRRVSRDPLLVFFCVFFLQEAVLSKQSQGMAVHSTILFIQHFLCQPWHRPPSTLL